MMLLEKTEGILKKNSRRIAIGYDLCDSYAQISYCFPDSKEPETLAVVTGTEQFNIPLVLCKKNGVNQWFYGREALKFAGEGEGVLVKDLLSLARDGESVEIDGDSFDSVALLTLFIKRSMSALGMIAPPEYLEGIMLTTDDLDKRMVDVFSRVAANLHLKTDKIFFQSHVESFYYYTIYQPEELWTYEVLLCDYDNRRMKVYALNSNRKTTPVVMYIDIEQYGQMRRREPEALTEMEEAEKHLLDMQFLDIVKEKCKDRIISCAYLIGEGYKEDWASESLKYLCMGRRVFMGNNLYGKGACYGIREKLGWSEAGKNYAFLGLDKLKANIGMKVLRKGMDSYFAVMDAGVNWFEAGKEYDVILEDGSDISIILTPLNGKEAREIHMTLEGIPERPKRTTRLRIAMEMTSENQVNIRVKDMGFGELFPSSGGEWVKTFDMV